jgi:hypothetical protein
MKKLSSEYALLLDTDDRLLFHRAVEALNQAGIPHLSTASGLDGLYGITGPAFKAGSLPSGLDLWVARVDEAAAREALGPVLGVDTGE